MGFVITYTTTAIAWIASLYDMISIDDYVFKTIMKAVLRFLVRIQQNARVVDIIASNGDTFPISSFDASRRIRRPASCIVLFKYHAIKPFQVHHVVFFQCASIGTSVENVFPYFHFLVTLVIKTTFEEALVRSKIVASLKES